MAAAFPIDAVRAQFPALMASPDAVFLDNPAGTQVPNQVIDAVSDCFRNAYANLGGAFTTTLRADALVERAHAQAALFCNANSPREVAIGASMTELTYALSRALARGFRPGDEILITSMDHEANVSPWIQVAEDFDLTLRKIRFDETSWRIEPEALAEQLSARSRLVALNYASNLTGAINDVAALSAVAKAAGALVYVDAVQAAPHIATDVQALGCDFLVCSAYKFFGPHISILWGRESLLAGLPAERLRCGPTGPAAKFERGTVQMELQAGLSAAIDYMTALGQSLDATAAPRAALTTAFTAARSYEETLVRPLIDGLANLPGITIHGPTDLQALEGRVPTVSFTSDKVSCTDLAQGLADQHIYAWSGHNYAYEIAQQLGLDMTDGVLRLGIAHYNTAAEIERTVEAVATLTR